MVCSILYVTPRAQSHGEEKVWKAKAEKEVGLSQIRYEAEIKGQFGSSWQKMRQEKVKWWQRGMNKKQTASENLNMLQVKSNI